MPVEDKDHGWSELAKRVEALSGDEHVLVGVLGLKAAQPHGNGVTNLDVAAWNEFGTRNSDGTEHIPARSFIRATVDIHQDQLLRMSAKLGKGVISGAFAAGQALELLGEHAVGLMIQRINAHIPPPNAASTIKRKGSSTPLIAHTGQLKSSLSYKLGGVA
jgi:hypothetical protein